MTPGHDGNITSRAPGKASSSLCLEAVRRITLIALVAAAPTAASGRQTDIRDHTPDDSVLVRMMNAQVHVLEEYTRCVEGPGTAAPCQPPRPLQLAPIQDSPHDEDVHGESMVDSAARMLKNAEMRAIEGHAKCVKMKRSGCGPPP